MTKYVSPELCNERHSEIAHRLTGIEVDIKDIKDNHLVHIKEKLATISVQIGDRPFTQKLIYILIALLFGLKIAELLKVI